MSEPTTAEQLQAVIEVLEPVAKSGNLWSGLWMIRLKMVLAFGTPETKEAELLEFKAAINDMFQAVLNLRDVLVRLGYNFGGDGGTPTQGS